MCSQMLRLLQGFGNVGAWAAEIFQEMGGKVLAVSDAFGAVYNEQGLNVKALRKYLAGGKPLKEFPEGTSLPATMSPLHGLICQRYWKSQYCLSKACSSQWLPVGLPQWQPPFL